MKKFKDIQVGDKIYFIERIYSDGGAFGETVDFKFSERTINEDKGNNLYILNRKTHLGNNCISFFGQELDKTFVRCHAYMAFTDKVEAKETYKKQLENLAFEVARKIDELSKVKENLIAKLKK